MAALADLQFSAAHIDHGYDHREIKIRFWSGLMLYIELFYNLMRFSQSVSSILARLESDIAPYVVRVKVLGQLDAEQS